MFKTEYAIASILTCITTLFLALFVYIKGREKKLNLLYSFWALCVGLWSFFLFLNIYAPSQELALLWCRMLHVWAIILPAAYVHFVFLFLDRRRLGLVYFLYFLAATFIVLDFTPWFLSASYREKFDFFVTTPQQLYPLHVVTFVGSILYVQFELFKCLLEAKGVRRKQIQYFLAATVIGYSGGVTNYLINYDYLIFPLYPYGNYTILTYVVVIGVAIVRHRLMDIEVIIKKTLVFTGLFAMVMAVVAITSGIINGILGQYLAIRSYWVAVSSALIVMTVFDPTRRFLVEITDRYLFQKKQDFKVILNNLAKSIITILDLDQVSASILSTLQESLRVESAALILRDENDKGYHLLKSFGTAMSQKHYGEDDLLIQYFERHPNLLDLEETDLKQKIPTLVLARLEELRALLCLPLYINQQMIGLLTLGKKKSDEAFSREELAYFPTVVGQVAIALSNARLLEIQKKSQVEFIQQAKMAAVGTLSAGISHEIKNPLNNMRGFVEMYLMNKEAGFYRNHSKEDYDKVLDPIFRNIMEDTQKINEIITALSRFAHKGELEVRLEPVNLEKEVEQAYILLRPHLHQDVIDWVKDIPSNLPRVLGDGPRINEVLVNLINNARQAIKQNGTIRIMARKLPLTVELDIIDNGPGIPKDLLEKIFDPFFTTKDQGEGTGLGLYICREILKRMKARIWANSEVGKGAKFTLEFQIAS